MGAVKELCLPGSGRFHLYQGLLLELGGGTGQHLLLQHIEMAPVGQIQPMS